MKLQTVAQTLAPLVPALRCPRCGKPLTLADNRSLICQARHCFDLSAKGYVNLAPEHDQTAEKYDAALFASRARVFQAGFFAPVAQALCEALVKHTPPVVPAPLVVDVGCGEGYYAREMIAALPHANIVGVDLSRDAITTAARQAPTLRWLVGDLTRLPFASASVDALTDILTPADYREFSRVLKPGGVLIKAIPGDDYLIELRHAVADQLRAGEFSNVRVVDHLREHVEVLDQITVRHTLPVTPEQAADLMRMTPMTFHLSEAQLSAVQFSYITIAMELFVCQMQASQ